jgi:hypothetical protein
MLGHYSADLLAAQTARRDRDEFLTAALEYAGRGWWVFPVHGIRADGRCTCDKPNCGSLGKHPRTKSGVLDATTDLEQIKRWWRRWPDANIGIASGPSGLVVIDIDAGEGKEGEASFAALEAKYGPFPQTVESLTGGGGRHLLFKAGGSKVAPLTNAFGADFPHIDIRAGNSYIVAPPSRHASGRQYAWSVDGHPGDQALAMLPDWVPGAVVGGGAGGKRGGGGSTAIIRNSAGLVVDGRETFLRNLIAAHFWRLLDEFGDVPSWDVLAGAVWLMFSQEAALRDGRWTFAHAEAKAKDAIRRHAEGLFTRQEASADVPPHYPRPTINGVRASRNLRRITRRFYNQSGRVLSARAYRDGLSAEWLANFTPMQRSQAEARARKALLKRTPDLTATEQETAVETIAERGLRRTARLYAAKEAKQAFKLRSLDQMPRIQVKGAAGLGKSSAVIDELLRLVWWGRNVNIYVPTIVLAKGFAADLNERAKAMAKSSVFRPRAYVIQGRTHGCENGTALCHSDRVSAVAECERAVSSVYRSCCHLPATEDQPEQKCPHYDWCCAGGYLAQFADKSPAIRILTHQHLALRQPADLALPEPDLIIVDETVIGSMIADSVMVSPGWLSDPNTYKAGEGQEIQDAIDIGRAVATAIQHRGDFVARLHETGITVAALRTVAGLAERGDTTPDIRPSFNATQIKRALQGFERGNGWAVAILLRQLVNDLERGRKVSLGVEYVSAYPLKDEAGMSACMPMFLVHGMRPLTINKMTALLLIDADADIDINRRIFGDDLRAFNVPAMRRGYVVQCLDTSFAKSSLVPPDHLPNNREKAALLLDKIKGFVARWEGTGKRVLVVTNKPVRRALTGEPEGRLPVYYPWMGDWCEISHYGVLRGVNRWKAFDVIVVIGREQMPPEVAEGQARAIYANTDVVLNLPGEYVWERRGFDVRDGFGSAEVHVHPDPRVQALVELTREQGIGQAIDRLRLIHPDGRVPEIFVLTDLPIPGLVVDKLVSKDDLFAGGTVWDRALAEGCGVMLLDKAWLSDNLPGLFHSSATAGREIARLLKSITWQYKPYCQVILFRREGQRRQSRALVSNAVRDPRAALERLLGGPLAECRPMAMERTPDNDGRQPKMVTVRQKFGPTVDLAMDHWFLAAATIDATTGKMAPSQRVIGWEG